MINLFLAKFYLFFVMFIPGYLYIFYKPGLPVMSFSRFYIAIWLLVVFYMVIVRKNKLQINSYPFIRPVVVLVVTLFFVSIFADKPLSSFQYLLSICFEAIIPTILVWSVLDSSKDMENTLKWLIVAGVIILFYGIVTYLINYNPILELGLYLSESGPKTLIWSYGDSQRVGLVGRAQSVFPHPMNYGHFSVVFIFLLMLMYSITTGAKKYLYIIVIPCFVYALLSTNSRTPAIFLISGLFVFWLNVSVKVKVRLALLFLLSLLLLMLYGLAVGNMNYFDLLFGSLSHYLGGDGSQSIGGSSIDMRLKQLQVSINLFFENPILGHGLTTLSNNIANGVYKNIWGGESFAYYLLIDVGLLGILAYTYFYGYFFKYFINNLRNEDNSIQIKNIANIAISLLFGHLIFVMATGEMNTLNIILMILVILAKYIEDLKKEKHQVAIQ